MCENVGRKVKALHRTKIGNIDVKQLKIGEWRYLKEDEIKSLQKWKRNSIIYKVE